MTPRDEVRRIALATFIGTALEWYDYFLYGTAASIVFNRLFFASKDPVVATAGAFATFAVGFLARPIGAAVFGHFGDRYGRRNALIITVTGIGVVTGLIGVLPTYASIGIAAPVLLTLLRILQGIAVGGEWSGAMTVTIEHAPAAKRGRYGALPQIGSPVGTLLSSGAFALVALLPDESFDAWGWRLPFLAAFPLLGVVLYLRWRLEESPVFRELLEKSEPDRFPMGRLVTRSPLRLLTGIAAALLGIGGFYLLTTFMISYGTETLKLPKSLLLNATLVGAVVEVAILVAFGRLAERFGSAKVTVFGGVVSAVFAFPVFWLVDTKQPALVIIGITVGIALLSIPYAVNGPLLSELFETRVRYSGVALASNLSGAISGFVPLIATGFLAASGKQSWSVALLLVVIALFTALGGYFGGRLRLPDSSVSQVSPSALGQPVSGKG